MTKKYKASCLCQAVQFEVDRFDAQAGHCHCTMCRKFHGAAFATLGSAPAAHFHWIQGESDVKAYTAENGTVRSFCQHCGTSLFFATPNFAGDSIEIALAVFDDDIPVQPNAHIFVDFGANWVVATDDLPKFSAGRQSEQRS